MPSVSCCRPSLSLVAVAALAVCSPATAQVDYQMNMPFYNEYVHDFLQGVILPPESAVVRSGEDDGEEDASTPSDAEEAPARDAWEYVPSLSRRRDNVARFIRADGATDPERAASLARYHADTDVIAAFEDGMREAGLSESNVADAFAAWWATAWLGSQGIYEPIGSRSLEAVGRQVTDGLRASGQFEGVSDARKQEIAEAFIYDMLIISVNVDQALRKNPAMMPEVTRAIRRGAREQGLDLDAMVLTPDGFVPRDD